MPNDSPSRPIRIASVNVNGVRAAYRKGMNDWLEGRGIDILAMQEVRAETTDLEGLLGSDWTIVNDIAHAKGRAGVALASRIPAAGAPRVTLGADDFDSSGRWIESDFDTKGRTLTVVSVYVNSGEADTPKQVEKYRFLDAMADRLSDLRARNPLTLVVGDFNVGHGELDIKNWKGNVKNSGFLPRERSYLDRFTGELGAAINCVDGSIGVGLGWIDVGRRWAGDTPGPYTWWSMRGKAFDSDTGWRIDYHLATPELHALVADYAVDRAAAWDQRWSDHAPVVVDYAL